MMMVSNSGCISVARHHQISSIAIPALAEAYTNGQSNWSSVGIKIDEQLQYFVNNFIRSCFRTVDLVDTYDNGQVQFQGLLQNELWSEALAPSKASTTRITPFTIFRTRSTSPPKSACPGVSMMLILVSL